MVLGLPNENNWGSEMYPFVLHLDEKGGGATCLHGLHSCRDGVRAEQLAFKLHEQRSLEHLVVLVVCQVLRNIINV